MPDLLSFIITSIILIVLPGPDNLYILSQSAIAGSRIGYVIAIGICSGLLLQTIALIFGLDALLSRFPSILFYLQLTGVCYLLYLALEQPLPPSTQNSPSFSNLRLYYYRGLWMNVTNPKVLLFFFSYLPQFIEQPQNSGRQLLVLGCIFILLTALLFSAYAMMAHPIYQWLHRHHISSIAFSRIERTLYGLLAGYLLIDLLSF
ncbi:MAG TPA: threonine transporter RhtB [Gammaproteobacteria bacterium]|nr:threonine transporter RhtB [Gammaproteobacteria bacterium]